MNKAELKKILKPLIKECIKEVIFEDGTLSTIISEVLKGTSNQQVVYEKKTPQRLESNQEANTRRQRMLKEQKKKMLDAIGNDAFNGVDLFEGTAPLRESGTPGTSHKPNVLGDDPNDAGVDISSIMGNAGKIWQALKQDLK